MNQHLDILKNITSSIKIDLELYQKEFDKALLSEVSLINTVSKYMMRNRGKNIRPILTILSARLCSEPTENTYRAAAMVELLHIATLIHDDVVDDATLRRGRASVNKIWKNKLSVLMGDFILSRALINMIDLRDFDALSQISKTAEHLSAGEILQMERSFSGSMTEEVYFDMIGQKTASLLATSCELGAITTTKKNDDRAATSAFGQNLGIAFQIKDDLFDLLGKESDTGKNSGGDVKRNMMTLPLIYSKNNMNRKDYRELKKLLGYKKKNTRIMNEITELINKTGGIDYSKKKLDDYSSLAINAISHYPPSSIKKSCEDLVHFNKNRLK